MSNIASTRLLFRNNKHVVTICSKRFRRHPFGPPPRNFEDKNRMIIQAHRQKKLELAEPIKGRPEQWQLLKPAQIEPKIVKKERKLPSLVESKLPYYNDMKEKDEDYNDWYDPLFNPHLHEERHRVDPEEEPFNAIYADSKSESANDYTKVRDITTPELWSFVESLARLKVAPVPERRKLNEPIKPLPSGFVPPAETPPELPYFIARTRNHILPVYYHLDSCEEKCYTMVKQVTGNLWKLEEDLRTHLESLCNPKRRILTSVHETDERVLFRGKHLNEIVAWLYEKGF